MNEFLRSAVVYLAAAVVAVPVAKRLGLGSVLGYLLAGVVIGPSLLGFVGTEGQDVLHAAEFGVVMMLFIIALELEPALLWRMRGALLGMGGVQVLLSTVVLAGAALLVDQEWRQAVAIGAILSLSSTAIVLQTLQEKGLMKVDGGEKSFAVLLFQDLAFIPILALLPLLATGDAVAAALLLVTGIAVLMQAVGLSPALGTFVAGVVLATSEFRHALEADIEPFKGLLLGLFFIAVGATIDFGLIAAQLGTVLTLVAGLLFLKFAVLWTLGRVAKMATDQHLLFALALAQGGEFGFVLLAFATQNAVLPEATANLLVAAIALSMALTPLLLLLWERGIAPRFGTRRAPSRAMDTPDTEHAVIIVGFGDFGSSVGRLLNAAGIGTTVLDLDSDRVDLLRRMGLRVYYGDAGREDLLKSAGAEQAELVILCVGDPEVNLMLARRIHEAYPHLKILARASGRLAAYELLELGVSHVYRESMDAAMRVGEDALALLGRRRYASHRLAQAFRRRDEENVRRLATVFRDRQAHLSQAREAIRELEGSLRADAALPPSGDDAAWDAGSLRQEFGKRTT